MEVFIKDMVLDDLEKLKSTLLYEEA